MLSLTTTFYRLGWAALLGSIIGAERTVRRRPAGMRTSVCVTVAAALFTIVSVEIARLPATPPRRASLPILCKASVFLARA